MLQAFICGGIFITYATSLASASASLFPGLVNIPEKHSAFARNIRYVILCLYVH